MDNDKIMEILERIENTVNDIELDPAREWQAKQIIDQLKEIDLKIKSLENSVSQIRTKLDDLR